MPKEIIERNHVPLLETSPSQSRIRSETICNIVRELKRIHRRLLRRIQRLQEYILVLIVP